MASMFGMKNKQAPLKVGDRVRNNGTTSPQSPLNANAGKLGTVVSIIDDTAFILYDDSSTGMGEFKHYDKVAILKPSRTMPHNNSVNALAALYGGFSAGQTVSHPITNTMNTQNSKFQVGQKVWFVEGRRRLGNGDTLPDFESPDYYTARIGHGTVILGEEYERLGARIVEQVVPKKYLVTWISSMGMHMALEFDEKYLQSDEPEKPKEPFKLKDNALDSLILEASVKKEIMAVLKQHQHSGKLFDEWGLGETIGYGRGMSLMFWGAPGTGKTWAAHCIAKALETELLVISAAEIQSSEPGAANRNIQEAFKSAKEENKVLFLDECDSLITTRSDLGMVLASEVNTLLTEIEKFEGVCILATNRIETMDEALERRLALIVEFPFPKYAQRKEIWSKLLPKKMPLEDGVTVDVLAQDKLTGGQIKNVILQAARLALANEEKHVAQLHFTAALERLKKSKNLMGSMARSRTGRPMDGMSTGVTVDKKREIDTFLTIDKEEEKHG